MATAGAGTYIFSDHVDFEKERLEAIGWLYDPGTFAHLEALEIRPHWRCLEVGAGAGTVASWLIERLDERGSVLATDTVTRYMDHLDTPNLEVRRHDVVHDELPSREFDLIHSRMVLQHLGEREEVLAKLVESLKPGGVLLVEDSDWSALFRTFEPVPEFARLRDALGVLMGEAGFRHDWGLGNRDVLQRLPVVGLRSEGRVRGVQGGSPGARWYQMTYERIREEAIARGMLDADEFDRGIAMLEDPDRFWLSQVMIATWARRPAEG